mgnify:CR=1 FL=1
MASVCAHGLWKAAEVVELACAIFFGRHEYVLMERSTVGSDDIIPRQSRHEQKISPFNSIFVAGAHCDRNCAPPSA